MTMAEESIYNLIPREAQKQYKQPKHVSKFRSTVKDETSKGRGDYRTMGPAKVQTRTTENFLKKHEKEPQLPPKAPFKYPDEERKKPTVPKVDENPIHGLRTTKNFISQNAVENIMSVPKKPAKVFVDTKHGDKNQLEPSGLEPVFSKKRDFGRTPKYIERRKEEMQQAQDEYDAYVADHFRRGALQCLSDEDRNAILDGLKSNWEQLHHEYQGLSVVTDTAPKKYRKERMEAEMKQLERDIELIEKHHTIYIGH